jgi:methylenetetrahydrofolate dehydrogenase (NADP+)/methenyltetrahydrofolate cyclohydrolase
MSARLIDGRKMARELRRELVPQIEELRKHKVVPGLAMVLVGENPASLTYVGAKAKACEKLGLRSETLRLPQTVGIGKILSTVRQLNERREIHGVLVQLPLPPAVDPRMVAESIRPEKDVDGVHPLNVGRLTTDQETFVPCTPAGILELLQRSGNDPGGKEVVILGRSAIVGRPLALLLMAKRRGGNATVTVCHTATADLRDHCRRADILVVAMGRPEAIDGDMIRPGAVVIDVGVHRREEPDAPRGYRLVGDVHFPSAREVASWITPVPGGVGPMTISMLLKNTVQAAQRLTRTRGASRPISGKEGL